MAFCVHILSFFTFFGILHAALLCLTVFLTTPLDIKTLIPLLIIPIGLHLLEGLLVRRQIHHCIPADENDGSFQCFGSQCHFPVIWTEVLYIRNQFEELAHHNQRRWAHLLGRLSHELNTNIHAILGTMQIMSDCDIDKDFVRIVSHAGSVMANIASDFLDFSLCEEGQLTLSNQPFTISSIIQHLRLRFDGEAKRMGIALDFDVAENVDNQMVLGDFDRLCQILANLLCNSLVAMSSEPPTEADKVTVSIELCDEEPFVRFTVADKGCGIAPEDLEKLFLPFSRVSKASRRNAEPSPGCGMGLCICQHLVELMGGEIALTSSLTEGTDVTFTIPLAPPSKTPRRSNSSTVEPIPSHILGTPTTLWPGALLHSNVQTRLSRVPVFAQAPRVPSQNESAGEHRSSHRQASTSQSLPSSSYTARSKRSSLLSAPLSSHRSSNLTSRSLASTATATHSPNVVRLPPLPGQTLNPSTRDLNECSSGNIRVDVTSPLQGDSYIQPSDLPSNGFLQIPLLNFGMAQKEDASGSPNLSISPPNVNLSTAVRPDRLAACRLDTQHSITSSLRAFTDIAILRRSANYTSGASSPSPRSPPVPTIQINCSGSSGDNILSTNGDPLLCIIIDDNSINLILLKKMLLKTFHCEVWSFPCAEEALSAIRTQWDGNRKAVVLTDIHMPETNGIEFTAELRGDWDAHALPVFGVTADYTATICEECVRAGMQAVIAKPMTCIGLLEIIKSVLTSLWGSMPNHFVKMRIPECPIYAP